MGVEPVVFNIASTFVSSFQMFTVSKRVTLYIVKFFASIFLFKYIMNFAFDLLSQWNTYNKHAGIVSRCDALPPSSDDLTGQEICLRSRVYLVENPLGLRVVINAFKNSIDDTTFCGKTPCAVLISETLDTIASISLILKTLLLLICLFLAIKVYKSLFRKDKDKKRKSTDPFLSMAPFIQLLDLLKRKKKPQKKVIKFEDDEDRYETVANRRPKKSTFDEQDNGNNSSSYQGMYSPMEPEYQAIIDNEHDNEERIKQTLSYYSINNKKSN